MNSVEKWQNDEGEKEKIRDGYEINTHIHMHARTDTKTLAHTHTHMQHTHNYIKICSKKVILLWAC